MRISEFLNTIIKALNSIQKGQPFISTERTMKKVMAQSFNILTATTNWIQGVLEVMLKVTRCT